MPSKAMCQRAKFTVCSSSGQRQSALAVPAMPVDSPGMDGPAYGQRKDRYDVLLVAKAAAPLFTNATDKDCSP